MRQAPIAPACAPEFEADPRPDPDPDPVRGTQTDPWPRTRLRLPGWATAARPADDLDAAAVASGAALALLDLAVRHPDVPQALWRQRLALGAAEACVGRSGRPERAAALRDAVLFLRPGDHPGPAGGVLRAWQGAVGRPLSAAGLARALPDLDAALMARALAVGPGNPVARAASVLDLVLETVSEAGLVGAARAETTALILADAALARAAGWDRAVPLMAAGLGARDLRTRGADLRLACHRALVVSARTALPLAHDLAGRAAALRAVAPKLRAKGADRAVARFLVCDALAPASLTDLFSDRAARRLCDRLVTLGAVRELTGRETFRLYGL